MVKLYFDEDLKKVRERFSVRWSLLKEGKISPIHPHSHTLTHTRKLTHTITHTHTHTVALRKAHSRHQGPTVTAKAKENRERDRQKKIEPNFVYPQAWYKLFFYSFCCFIFVFLYFLPVRS